ncbi:MAG: GNAT family N-acetyltransferase [Ruminococcaceae bacterium]|nr:GNAT family N-acetyltransferase [Oscillospiraceae bacterium]
MNEICTIQISKFLTHELTKQIALKQWKSSEQTWTNRSRQYIFDELINGNDCFGVIATASNNEIIGRIHCVKNKTNPYLWYYGELFVIPEYRKMGIAKQMISATINHLSEIGAKTLRCYVEPENIPSRNLQISMGFSEKDYETFNNFINEGEIMYEIGIPNCLTVIPATANESYFVRVLFGQNRSELNTDYIDEWEDILSAIDPDEEHFLICKGAMPVAYMKINGLQNKNEAWISMLFVAKEFQRQGIGTFAIHYAEQYVKEKNFDSIAIQTDTNNLAAKNCYLKCGYQIYESSSKIKFRKTL